MEKYLLIVADGEVSLSSAFYYVMVGITQIDAKRLQALSMIANAKGYFFQKYTVDCGEFLFKIAASLNVEVYNLPFRSVKVAECLNHYRMFGVFPPMEAWGRCHAYLAKTLSLETRMSSALSVLHQAEAGRRNKPKSLAYGNNPLKGGV